MVICEVPPSKYLVTPSKHPVTPNILLRLLLETDKALPRDTSDMPFSTKGTHLW